MNIWKLLDEVATLQKAFTNETKDTGFFKRPKFSFLSGLTGLAFPEVNLSDDKEHFIVEAVIPGIEPSSLSLSVTGNVLSISGEKPELKVNDQEVIHRQERTSGKFVRTIDLPAGVDSNKVNAEYHHGILRVTIGKTPEAQPKKIEITVK